MSTAIMTASRPLLPPSTGRERSKPPTDGISNIRFPNLSDNLLVSSWDGKDADDAAEGRVKHHRSPRMGPRKLLLFIAIMACMATMGIQYYRIAERGPPSPLDRETAEVRISQKDVKLFCLWLSYTSLEDGDSEKDELLKEIKVTVQQRTHLDASFDKIRLFLFGPTRAANPLRSRGLPLVDDGDCFKSMVQIFQRHCGWLGEYGLKHTEVFEDICNNNVSYHKMEKACFATCGPPITNIKDYNA